MSGCLKCGSPTSLTNNDEVKYYKGDILIIHNEVMDSTTLGEWLVFTCHRCGYKRKELCKDAEQDTP